MIQLRDVLHLYLNCDVQYPDSSGGIVIAKFTGFSREDGIETTYKTKVKKGDAVGDYLSWKPSSYHSCDANHLKPILRPLSSMTEEEKHEFFKLQYGDDEKYNERLVGFAMGGKSGTYTLFPETFQYLLSKGFDLFNLIPSHQALEKTT